MDAFELDQLDRDRVAGGRLYEVDVTAAPGALSYLTCSSEALRRPRHYAARILRERAV